MRSLALLVLVKQLLFGTCLQGEDVEDLLETGLLRAVLLYRVLALEVFEHAEDGPNGVLVSAHFKRVRVAVVLDQRELLELLLNLDHDCFTILDDMSPFQDFLRVYSLRSVQHSCNLLAKALLTDFAQ